jgi:hypothetical protein
MRRVRAGLLFAGILIIGCGGDKLYDLKGTVTIGGNPVPAGVIWFEPDVSKGNMDGPQGYAQIENGKFDTRQNGRGVRPGLYTIRVEAFDGKPANELPLGTPLISPPHETSREFKPEAAELTIDIPSPNKK